MRALDSFICCIYGVAAFSDDDVTKIDSSLNSIDTTPVLDTAISIASPAISPQPLSSPVARLPKPNRKFPLTEFIFFVWFKITPFTQPH